MSQTTPDTDAIAFRVGKNALHPSTVVVALNDAKRLERERNEVRQNIRSSVRAIIKAMPNTAFTGELGQAVGVLLAELYRLQPAKK